MFSLDAIGQESSKWFLLDLKERVLLTRCHKAIPTSSSPWSHIPLHVLRSELQRRQKETDKPECGTEGHGGEYNTPAHVFALILILVLSTGGKASKAIHDMLELLTNEFKSLLLSNNSSKIPQPLHPPSISLPISSFRNRCPHCDGLCPPPTDCLHLPNRSMSSRLLEQKLSGHARPDSNDLGASRGGHRDVFCH